MSTCPRIIRIEQVAKHHVVIKQTGLRGIGGGFRWWYGDGAPSEEIIAQALYHDLYFDELSGDVWAFEESTAPKIIDPPEYTYCW